MRHRHSIVTTALSLILLAAAGTASALSDEIEISAAGLDSRELFERGRDAFHRAWFERADELLGETVAVDPELAIAQAYKAASESFLYRDPAGRIARARQAGHANEAERMMTDALLSFTEGDYESTVATLRRLLETHPDDRYARHALGFTLIDLGRTREGVGVLSSLLADHSDFVAAWNHLGYAYLDLGDLDRAEQAMARFVTEDPDNPASHDSWADVLVEEHRYDEAVASLTRATLLEPTYAYGMAHLGDVLLADGSPVLARAAYHRAIEMASADSPRYELVARQRIAATWVRQLQLDAARTELGALTAAADSLADPGSALAGVRARMTIELVNGDAEAAGQTLELYQRRVADLGEHGADLGEPTQITFFEGWLSVVEGNLSDADALLGDLEAAADEDDLDALALADRLSGEISMAQLQYADAIEAFESAGADDPLVAVRLALAYEGDNKPAAAQALFDSAAACEDVDIGCALAATLAAPLFDLDWSLPALPLPQLPPSQEPPPEEPDDGSVSI
jgi:tetratricopeptide (TPR) repeat protein